MRVSRILLKLKKTLRIKQNYRQSKTNSWILPFSLNLFNSKAKRREITYIKHQ